MPPVLPEDRRAAEERERQTALPLGRYFALGALFWLVMAMLEVRLESNIEYGLQRLDRLHEDAPLVFSHLEPVPLPEDLAQQLKLANTDVLNGQFVVEEYLNRLSRAQGRTWSRVLEIPLGDYTLVLNGTLFLHLVTAFFFAGAYYYRRRFQIARELRRREFEKELGLKAEIEEKKRENARGIDKFTRIQKELVQAEKLASVGRLSATLAHEIRNPLTIIKSATDLVAYDLRESGRPTTALDVVREEVTRMDRIITDLLSFSRPRAPNLERIDIVQLVRHWLPPFVEELEKDGIRIVPQFEKDGGEVAVDADQLYQVFMNVMWNARDALRGMSNPHVFVRTEDGGPDYLKLVVQDTGPGMLPETLRQVREPFFTTKTRGTGLGLPVSVQLTEAMGGQFDIQSTIEVGTSVILTLPRSLSPLRRIIEQQQSRSDQSGQHRAAFRPASDSQNGVTDAQVPALDRR